MSFFISDAVAAAPQGQGDALTSFLPLIFIFVVFYFLLIRPQSKKAKEHKQMVGALAKGDEVVTNGGLLGRITKVGDNFVEVFVNTPIEICEQRDVKGLYKKARAGQIKNFTGIDSAYEPPKNADIHVHTENKSVEECAEFVVNQLSQLGYI